MAIRSGTCYWVVCDVCSYPFNYNNYIGAIFHTESKARAWIENSDAHVKGDVHLCSNCDDDA